MASQEIVMASQEIPVNPTIQFKIISLKTALESSVPVTITSSFVVGFHPFLFIFKNRTVLFLL